MTGTYQGKTAQEWREQSAHAYKGAQESFDRSDTDGALSQWSLGLSERKYSLCADVAEQDGWWEFRALFDLNGNLCDAREVETRFGWAWAISIPVPGQHPTTVWFNASQAKNPKRRLANDTAKGYRFGIVRRRAYVTLSGGNMFSVRPIVKPDKYDDRVEIIDDGSQGTCYTEDE